MIVLFILLWIAGGYYAVFKYKGRNGLTHSETFWKTVEAEHGMAAVKRTLEILFVLAILTVVGGAYTLLHAWADKHFPDKVTT